MLSNFEKYSKNSKTPNPSKAIRVRNIEKKEKKENFNFFFTTSSLKERERRERETKRYFTHHQQTTTMHLSTSNVEYILAKFDAGVPSHRIVIGLQYRAFLPSIDVATIEQCLYDNGRLMKTHQAAITIKDDRSRGGVGGGGGVGGHASNSLPPPANESSTPRASATTEETHQFPTGAAAIDNFAAPDDDDLLVDPGPMLLRPWDAQADDFALTAYQAGNKSRDEIWTTLRSRGYDISRAEVVTSLIRQGVQVTR